MCIRDSWKIANSLQSGLKKAGFNIGNTESAVTPVYLSGGVGEATNLTLDLRENFGIFCSIVTYPVVPKGCNSFKTYSYCCSYIRRCKIYNRVI